VFVRGFDFGTTDEQFESHMSGVGSIEKVKWVTKGSAEVTYSSPEEAAAAVEQLQKTTIEGNSRFIDVLAKEDGDRPAKRFNSGGAAQWGGKGQGGLLGMLQGALFGGGKSWGKGGGRSKGKGGGGAVQYVDQNGNPLGPPPPGVQYVDQNGNPVGAPPPGVQYVDQYGNPVNVGAAAPGVQYVDQNGNPVGAPPPGVQYVDQFGNPVNIGGPPPGMGMQQGW